MRTVVVWIFFLLEIPRKLGTNARNSKLGKRIRSSSKRMNISNALIVYLFIHGLRSVSLRFYVDAVVQTLFR